MGSFNNLSLLSIHRYDHLLAVSFVGETRFLTISGEEIEQTEIDSFASAEQTFFCGNVSNDQIVQVCENFFFCCTSMSRTTQSIAQSRLKVAASGVRLVDATTFQQNDVYVPRNGKKISVAACNHSQILISTGGGQLIYLEIEGKALVQKGYPSTPPFFVLDFVCGF